MDNIIIRSDKTTLESLINRMYHVEVIISGLEDKAEKLGNSVKANDNFLKAYGGMLEL